MGMTDKQFNAFLRFVASDINRVIDLLENNKTQEAENELKQIAEKFRETMEDQQFNVMLIRCKA